MAAQYRKLLSKFWSDPEIQSLLKEKRHTEVLLLLYTITGATACSDSAITGIYEIYRGNFNMFLHFSDGQINDALDFFNQKKPHLLQYDEKTHMIFVKNLYKHNASYKPNASTVVTLMQSYEETFQKAPVFWTEFGQNYRAKLGKIMPVLENPAHVKFLEELFDLKSLVLVPPSSSPKSTSSTKLDCDKDSQKSL